MNQLSKLEKIIKLNLSKPFELGKALREIRDQKLYKFDYNCFKHYLEIKWNITKSGAYQKIKCADIQDIVPDVENEYQATELARLGKNKRAIKTIWNKAKKIKQPTTQRLIKKLIDEKLGVEKIDWLHKKINGLEKLSTSLSTMGVSKELIDQLKEVIDKMKKLDLTD